ncbi:hypothetical protein VNO77_44168 [Canavalia gladiata]|uniref:Uncharacterized protein n=1 Tax=Canavalia gladiata TaxID=3824 RepID=A0AAN9PQI2_CANGL
MGRILAPHFGLSKNFKRGELILFGGFFSGFRRVSSRNCGSRRPLVLGFPPSANASPGCIALVAIMMHSNQVYRGAPLQLLLNG